MWSHANRDINDEQVITQLLKCFKLERPRAVNSFPQWDLGLVLRVLRHSPYEPLDKASMSHLSQKTLFLLLLASGRRRGDVHAIDPKRITHRPGQIVLWPYPGYQPKRSRYSEAGTAFQPIVIKWMTGITVEPEELTLCPARVLMCYDKAAAKALPDRKRFFVSLKSPYKEVSANTLSAWFAKLIARAYSQATVEDCRLQRVRLHETRALAATMAHTQSTYSLDALLGAASWAGESVFTSFYLRDLAGLRGARRLLIPFQAAGATVHST